MAAADDVPKQRGKRHLFEAHSLEYDEDNFLALPSRLIGDDGYYYECEICDNGGDLLCCDTCPRVYHLECLTPPLDCTPPGSWFCPNCNERADLFKPKKEFRRSITIKKSFSRKEKHFNMNKLEGSSTKSLVDRSSNPIDENAVNQNDEGKSTATTFSIKNQVIVYRRSRAKGHVGKGENSGSTILPKDLGPSQEDNEIREEDVATMMWFGENSARFQSASSQCANREFKNDASCVGMVKLVKATSYYGMKTARDVWETVAWLINSMIPEVGEGYYGMKTARDVWEIWLLGEVRSKMLLPDQVLKLSSGLWPKEEEMPAGIAVAQKYISMMDDTFADNQQRKAVSLMIGSGKECNGAAKESTERHQKHVQLDSEEPLSDIDLKYTTKGKALKEKFAKLRGRQKKRLALRTMHAGLHWFPKPTGPVKCLKFASALPSAPVRKPASSLNMRTSNQPKNSNGSQMMFETWCEDELDALWVGVRRHGQGYWEEMLNDPTLIFSKNKTSKALSERWETERLKLSNSRSFQKQKQLRDDFPNTVSPGACHQATSSRSFKNPSTFTFYPCKEKMSNGGKPSSGQNLLLGGSFLLPAAGAKKDSHRPIEVGRTDSDLSLNEWCTEKEEGDSSEGTISD